MTASFRLFRVPFGGRGTAGFRRFRTDFDESQQNFGARRLVCRQFRRAPAGFGGRGRGTTESMSDIRTTAKHLKVLYAFAGLALKN